LTRRLDLGAYLALTDEALSRTARTGFADPGRNEGKREATTNGAALQALLSRNREIARTFIDWRRSVVPNSADEIYSDAVTLGHIANLGITSGGLFRAWAYECPAVGGGAVPVNRISTEMLRLAERCARMQDAGEEQQRATIAEAEWEIGIGPLHPFYDACGRVSRYFSTLLSLRTGTALPLYDSRSDYMDAATAGLSAFTDYRNRRLTIRL
jgi:hypothetical protein